MESNLSTKNEERLNNFCHWVARKLPKRVVYWCIIVAWARVTGSPDWGDGKVCAPYSVTVSDMVDRWEKIG